MHDFDRIFFRNEFRSLAGKAFASVFTLSGIIAITILALGFSAGSLIVLKEKMKNPYTNWIDIPVPSTIQPDSISAFFESSSIRDSFLIKSLGKHDVYFQSFMQIDQKDISIEKGTTVFPDEDIVQSVLHDIPGNLLAIHDSLSSNPCGLIVTQKLLVNLGYTAPFDQVLKIQIPVEGEILFVDVLAVVKELPSLNSFFSSPVLKNMIVMPNYKTGFITQEQSYLFSVMVHKNPSISNDAILEHFARFSPKRIDGYDEIDLGSDQKYDIRKIVFSLDSFPSQDTLINYMAVHPLAGVLPYAEFACKPEFDKVENTQHLAFHFSALDRIPAFKELMIEKFGVEVSLQQIESAQNFLLVSTLTRVISYILFGFALLSIGFYVSSLVRSHLQRISPHLGTLKAFGIHNKRLILIYARVIALFCTIAIMISFIFCCIVQKIISEINIQVKLDVFSPIVLIALLLVLILSIWITVRTTKSIVFHTPGDLIYNRV